jgi:hypothetical protein
MREHRPLSRASAPKEPPSKLTGRKAVRARTPSPETPLADSKGEDLTAAANLQPSNTHRHPSLNALARLLGRQLARETSGKGGCDD